MKVLVVYDSFFGNTEQIARAVGHALEAQGEVETVKIGEVKHDQLRGKDLLIVGSPTRAFQPTQPIKTFLKNITPSELKGVKVAAFDTRISVEDTNSGFLKFMVKIFGYAAKPIGDGLMKKGGSLVQPPEGFYVKDSEGPLKEGELDRATAWARSLC